VVGSKVKALAQAQRRLALHRTALKPGGTEVAHQLLTLSRQVRLIQCTYSTYTDSYLTLSRQPYRLSYCVSHPYYIYPHLLVAT
jgi:hypothetical protein